jgi:hypothetical protein
MQTSPSVMTTLSGVLEKLRIRRQDNEFIMSENGFTPGNNKFYTPEDSPSSKPIVLKGNQIRLIHQFFTL